MKVFLIVVASIATWYLFAAVVFRYFSLAVGPSEEKDKNTIMVLWIISPVTIPIGVGLLIYLYVTWRVRCFIFPEPKEEIIKLIKIDERKQ